MHVRALASRAAGPRPRALPPPTAPCTCPRSARHIANRYLLSFRTSSSADEAQDRLDEPAPSPSSLPLSGDSSSASLSPGSAHDSEQPPPDSTLPAVTAHQAAEAAEAGTSDSTTSTSNSSEEGTSADEPQSPPGPSLSAALSSVRAFFDSLLSKFLLLLARVRNFPSWARAQHLSRLKELSDAEPGNADKHVAYLQELSKRKPLEVLARVESKQYANSSAVVVEYLKALVASGKVGKERR